MKINYTLSLRRATPSIGLNIKKETTWYQIVTKQNF